MTAYCNDFSSHELISAHELNKLTLVVYYTYVTRV